MTFPAPVRRPPPRPVPYPLEGKDTLREWVDAHDVDHLPILSALQRLPNDYYASCGYLRAHRPRTAGPALTFWSAPLSKAHAINALLCRGERSIVQVHADCDLGRDKLYDYAANWGIHFSRIEGDASCTVQDPDGRTAGGRIVRICRASREGYARIDGYTLVVPIRYDPRSRLCYTTQTLNLGADSLLSYPVASRMLSLTPDTLRRVLPPDTFTAAGDPLLWLTSLDKLLSRDRWYMPVTRALREVRGACGPCTFWDDHAGRCGLDHRHGGGQDACEDFRH